MPLWDGSVFGNEGHGRKRQWSGGYPNLRVVHLQQVCLAYTRPMTLPEWAGVSACWVH